MKFIYETNYISFSVSRRKLLLEWAEIEFKVVVKETDETYPADMAVVSVPVHIARNKALAVRSSDGLHAAGNIIIAADTIVVLDDDIIGKPRDRDDAIHILSRLSGRTHQVITGVAIMEEDRETLFADITEVAFHELSEQQILFYIDKYQPYDKAGAYAIQEWIGVIGIKSIQGDFYNVMGLPVSKVVKTLRDFQ